MRGRIDFKKLDGDDSANQPLKEKYTVTGYPRLVFTDDTGNALLNHRGAPDGPEEFMRLIARFVK